MGVPFLRIKKRREGESDLEEYLGKLIKLIPAPALGIYLTGKGFAPDTFLGWWAVVGLVLVVVFRIWGTQDPQRGLEVQWANVVVAFISFIIWVYAIGDQIATFANPWPWAASLAVLVWTAIAPLFVKADNQ